MAILVTARIRGFAGIPVPEKFHFFAGIPYREAGFLPGFYTKFSYKNLPKIKNLIKKKHIKFNTYFKLKVIIFFTQ